jgi:Fe-S cluster assembly protein SufD
VDGVYAAKLSRPAALPHGVRLAPLSDALISDEVATRLAAALPEDADAFTALNAAFWRDGAYLHVPAGVSLAEPVELLHVATGGVQVDHPRSLVVLDEGSQATVLETYVGLSGEPYLTNALTEVALGPGAQIDHVKATLESGAGFHIGHLLVSLARESRFASCAVTLGGRLVRHDVRAGLGAEQASCALDGLFVIGGDQHVDMHTLVDHAAPRAMSRQLYKGVLDGRARGVFNGRVVVRHGANGTDAHQTNKNLLLSDGVEVDSKPQLEIFADDVKCSHGAADGQLAEDAIFYLKSRGLDEAAARTLLTHGFANEVLDRIPVEAIRTWLAGHLAARLRGGRVLEEGPAAPLPSRRAAPARAAGYSATRG